MFIIAFVLDRGGWCVVDLIGTEKQVMAGPYHTPEEAVDAAKTMGWRIAQGWAP